jgi:hypothetical protein
VAFKVDPNKLDVVTVDVFTWTTQQGGTLAVAAHSKAVDGSNTAMSLNLSGNTQIVMIKGNGVGTWTYNARSTKNPTSMQATGNIGGQSALVTTTTARRRSVLERRAATLEAMSPAV